MRPRRLVAPREATNIFDDAVRQRALAVLTLQEGHDWVTFKSRFLERDPSGRFFVLDYQPIGSTPLPTLSEGQYTGVSFRHKSRKVLFATIVEATGHFVLDDKTSVPAVRYRWPTSMTELQRRAYHRTPVPSGMTLLVGFWPGGSAARPDAQASPLQITTGDLVDLSCGGALVRLHKASQPDWVDGQTLGLELQLPDGKPPVVIDGRYRGLRYEESGALSAGVQFIGLEMLPEGRVVLHRLSNAVQRLYRMGTPETGRRGRTAP